MISYPWVALALIIVLLVVLLLIGFHAVAALLGAILDACDPD